MPAPVAVQRRTVLIIAALYAVSLSLVASSYLFATVIFLAFAALCTPGIFASLARGSVRD